MVRGTSYRAAASLHQRLESGKLALKSITARLGFAAEQSLRKLSLKHLGVLPQQ